VRRPTSLTASRKTTTDDWLGLRPKSNVEIPSYEPSSYDNGGQNVSRRHDFRRQSTQQRTSRSAGLLFSDDEDDVKKTLTTTRNVFDSSTDTTYRGTGASAVPLLTTATTTVNGNAVDRTRTAVFESQTLSKRRETSPSITVAKKTAAATGKFNGGVFKGDGEYPFGIYHHNNTIHILSQSSPFRIVFRICNGTCHCIQI